MHWPLIHSRRMRSDVEDSILAQLFTVTQQQQTKYDFNHLRLYSIGYQGAPVADVTARLMLLCE